MIAEAARRAFALAPGLPEGVRPGRATPVRTVDGEPSYWLVEGSHGDRLVALARILEDGRLAAVGPVGEPRGDLGEAVTGLSAPDARRTMTAIAGGVPGAAVSEPVLVHDGPVGREAWRSVLTGAGEPAQWVFATGGGTYRRRAGTPRGGASPERP